MESAPTWGVCGGGNVPDFEPPRCGGRERPPYGAGETRRPPGKYNSPRPLQTHVGDDARIVPGCLRRRRVRGRDKSRPYGQILCSRQTEQPRCLPRFAGEGHGPPAGVRGRAGRADIESAPTWGVCGGGNVPDFEPTRCGGRERPPYETGGNTAAARENAIPAVHRRGGFHIRPVRGGAGFAGGACPSPTCRPGTTGQMGLPRPPERT